MKKVLLFIILLFSISLLTSCDFSFLQYQGDSDKDTNKDKGNNNDSNNENTGGSKDEEPKLIDLMIEGAEKAYGYLNVKYDPAGIKVYAIDENGVKTDVTKKAKFTADTSKLGVSIVEVTYLELDTSYAITVLTDRVKTLEASLQKVKLYYKPGEDLDLSDLEVSVVYHGGAKMAVDNYTYKLKYSGIEVDKLTVNGEYIVMLSYVDEYNVLHSVSFIVVVSETAGSSHTHTYSKTLVSATCTEKGYTLNRCVCGDEYKENYTDALGHTYASNVCSVCGEKMATASVSAVIEYISATQVKIKVDRLGSDITDFNISVKNTETNEIKIITGFSETITVDANTVYTVAGGYFTMINDVKYYINVSNTIDTSIYSEISNVQESKASVSTVYSNVVDINAVSLQSQAPNGYEFAGVRVSKADGEFVEDISYSGRDLLQIGDLEKNSEYLIQPYYDFIPIQTFTFGKENAVNDLEYNRLFFKGFLVLTSNEDAKLVRIRFTYDGDVLYKYFIEKGDNLLGEWYYDFLLPIKYEDYFVAGIYEKLVSVTENTDCELVLLPKVSTNTHKVVFKDFYSSIAKIVEVSDGGTAIAPTLPGTITLPNDTDSYYFNCWKSKTDNIKSSRIITPYYTYSSTVDLTPVISCYGLYVDKTSLSTNIIHRCENAVFVGRDIYLIDNNNNKIEYSPYQAFDSLTPNTEYTYYYIIYYDLGKGAGVESVEYSQSFKTTAEGEKLNNVTLTEISKNYHEVVVTASDSSINHLYYQNYEDKLSRTKIYKNQFKLTTVKENTSIEVYYGVQTGDVIKMYDEALFIDVPASSEIEFVNLEVDVLYGHMEFRLNLNTTEESIKIVIEVHGEDYNEFNVDSSQEHPHAFFHYEGYYENGETTVYGDEFYLEEGRKYLDPDTNVNYWIPDDMVTDIGIELFYDNKWNYYSLDEVYSYALTYQTTKKTFTFTLRQ